MHGHLNVNFVNVCKVVLKMLGSHDTVLKTCSGLILKDQCFILTIVGLIFMGQWSNWTISGPKRKAANKQ